MIEPNFVDATPAALNGPPVKKCPFCGGESLSLEEAVSHWSEWCRADGCGYNRYVDTIAWIGVDEPWLERWC